MPVFVVFTLIMLAMYPPAGAVLLALLWVAIIRKDR